MRTLHLTVKKKKKIKQIIEESASSSVDFGTENVTATFFITPPPSPIKRERKSKNLISKVHERSLRIVSGGNHSSFKSLLSKCKEIRIHQRNLQVLMTETYKIINGISPPIMAKVLYYEKTRKM